LILLSKTQWGPVVCKQSREGHQTWLPSSWVLAWLQTSWRLDWSSRETNGTGSLLGVLGALTHRNCEIINVLNCSVLETLITIQQMSNTKWKMTSYLKHKLFLFWFQKNKLSKYLSAPKVRLTIMFGKQETRKKHTHMANSFFQPTCWKYQIFQNVSFGYGTVQEKWQI
jgi:hypothetical protein